jgi:hypothetical protein
MRIWLKSFDKSTFFQKKTIFSLKKREMRIMPVEAYSLLNIDCRVKKESFAIMHLTVNDDDRGNDTLG